jgi:carboxymethylenebutenolidase
MAHERLKIRTDDGVCPCELFMPAEGEGPWPAVIVYMDAGGIRPAISDMSQRLANAGYLVLLPDLFYRYGAYGPFVPKEVFAGDFRLVLGPLMATTDNLKAAADTRALLAYLDTRDDVAGAKVGAIGFCMGGGMAITAAGTWPDRFAAVASFHGGRLATDQRPALICLRLESRRRSTSRRRRTMGAIRPRWRSGSRRRLPMRVCAIALKPTRPRMAG